MGIYGGMTIYLCGSIDSDPHYRRKFESAEYCLTNKGWNVLNPATLSKYLSERARNLIRMVMLQEADAVCMVDAYEGEHGHDLNTELEWRYAIAAKKRVFVTADETDDISDPEF